MTKKTRCIGLMSGTSLDGLDIAECIFWKENNKYYYSIEKTITKKYPKKLQNKLFTSHNLSSIDLQKLSYEFALFCGHSVKDFVGNNNIEFIASHGHTVFHQPEAGFSLQIGNGAIIAASSQIKTICDFRSGDVANLGQGAPLVPIGDKLLFAEYSACLNIGGFSNISYNIGNNRIAYDICPANIVLNHFAKYFNQEYDKNGNIAKTGELIEELYNELNKIEYYQKATPKSLGREWLEKYFMPIISKYDNQNKDNILYSLVEHISYQISKELKDKENCLITGGGAFNTFLIEQIQKKTICKLIIPIPNIVSFKEALIFAFLGYLRNIEEVNCLASYTGAKKDSCIGAIYLP